MRIMPKYTLHIVFTLSLNTIFDSIGFESLKYSGDKRLTECEWLSSPPYDFDVREIFNVRRFI